MKKAIIFVFLVVVLPACSFSNERLQHGICKTERCYQDLWCEGKGRAEVVLPDRTRCDCLTKTHAIEVDFAGKWYEAVGQALHYSVMTGKRPGILIIKGPGDQKYIDRLEAVINKFDLPITVWVVDK